MKTILKFDCGAEMRRGLPDDDETYEGFAKRIGSRPRPRDGRFRLVVLSPSGCDRPRMPDGEPAPCFGCPKKRSAGYKYERVFLEDGEQSNDGRHPKMGVVISCFPKEVPAGGSR